MRTPPERITLAGDTHLRWFTVEDAEAVARAVRESLEHLRSWMPWANEQSCESEFQRQRLARLPDLARRREEWQYGLFPPDETRVLGSFGLMTRRGPGTLEIGYWLHASATGHGHATRAAGALTEVAHSIDESARVFIYCDEANLRSAAVARRLGYRVLRAAAAAPEAPGESGRMLTWVHEMSRTPQGRPRTTS